MNENEMSENEWGFKICAQSGSGERKLTQTEPTKKKNNTTQAKKSEINTNRKGYQ